MTTDHEGRPQILIMDANERNAQVLQEFLRREGYDPIIVTDIDTVGKDIDSAADISFALIDIDRFERPIWPYCDRLDRHDVPFIVLSGLEAPTLQRESREHGARAFVDKPIPKRELLSLLRTSVES